MIRNLSPGERVPDFTPRRHHTNGYVRLWWTLAPSSYVTVYEHRVVDGFVTTAEHVHHENGIKDDNRPENLRAVTRAEHAAEHCKLDRQAIASAYLAGKTTTAIAAELGADSSSISRALRHAGIETRDATERQRLALDDDWLRQRHAEGMPVLRMAREMGVPYTQPIRRRMKQLGLAPRPIGRPRKPLAHPSSGDIGHGPAEHNER